MNQKGQAMIEAIIAGGLSLFSLYFIFTSGLKIINSSLQAEILEEQHLCKLSVSKNNCQNDSP